jgi:hypothetical protein
MYEYIFVYIVLPLIIIKIINFFVGNIFSIFFHVLHLDILDKVVSSLYANFGTPVCISRPRNHLTYSSRHGISGITVNMLSKNVK